MARRSILTIVAILVSLVLPGTAAAGGRLDAALAARAAAPRGTSRVIITTIGGGPADAAIKAAGGTAGRFLAALGGQAAIVPDTALALLAAHPDVREVAVDRPVSGTVERNAAAAVGAAWVREQLGLDGSGVAVAIIDSGVANWHDDLGSETVVHFVDFVANLFAPHDDYGHGTHVAGIIAGNGYDSGGARRGIAPGAKLVVLKVLDASGDGHISNVIAAIDYAVEHRARFNIRVINLSVAAGVHESYMTDPLTLAARRAVAAGIVVVTAAGNLGRSASGSLQQGGITSPGNAPWVLTVGATNHQKTVARGDDTVAPFSSRGPTHIDGLMKPDLVAPGVAIESLADAGSTIYELNPGARLRGTVDTVAPPYLALTGTSMAAPAVAGTIALMLEANPTLSPNLVKAILHYTAERKPRFDLTAQGAGFLNAKGAVQLAAALAGQTGSMDTTRWSRHILWGNLRVRGGTITATANAWRRDVVWGASTTPEGEPIVWGMAADSDTRWGVGPVDAAAAVDNQAAAVDWLPAESFHSVVSAAALPASSLRVPGLPAPGLPAPGLPAPVCRPPVCRPRMCPHSGAHRPPLAEAAEAMKSLPLAARLFVCAVIAVGAGLLATTLPVRTESPVLFTVLLVLSSVTSVLKVTLPLPRNASTMSVSYAVNFAGLLMLGTSQTMVIAAMSALCQCSFRIREPNPPHRTLFSMASLVITVYAAGIAYTGLGGTPGHLALWPAVTPLAGAAGTYFLTNTLLVASVIAFSTNAGVSRVWNENFLWSGPGYFVGAAVAAGVVLLHQFSSQSVIPLGIIPLYLTYRSYQVYLGRIAAEQLHVKEVADLNFATIEALALAIDAKDQTSQSHIRRVQLYATELARELGMSENHVQGVKTAALLHDIGKLAVPEHILSKPGPLTSEEFQKIRAHPKIGADIISAVPFPYPVAPLILSHHERWDGKGYPAGLRGEDIPLGARILTVVDCFDALMAERPYHKAMPYDAALGCCSRKPATRSIPAWSRRSCGCCRASTRRRRSSTSPPRSQDRPATPRCGRLPIRSRTCSRTSRWRTAKSTRSTRSPRRWARASGWLTR